MSTHATCANATPSKNGVTGKQKGGDAKSPLGFPQGRPAGGEVEGSQIFARFNADAIELAPDIHRVAREDQRAHGSCRIRIPGQGDAANRIQRCDVVPISATRPGERAGGIDRITVDSQTVDRSVGGRVPGQQGIGAAGGEGGEVLSRCRIQSAETAADIHDVSGKSERFDRIQSFRGEQGKRIPIGDGPGAGVNGGEIFALLPRDKIKRAAQIDSPSIQDQRSNTGALDCG